MGFGCHMVTRWSPIDGNDYYIDSASSNRWMNVYLHVCRINPGGRSEDRPRSGNRQNTRLDHGIDPTYVMLIGAVNKGANEARAEFQAPALLCKA